MSSQPARLCALLTASVALMVSGCGSAPTAPDAAPEPPEVSLPPLPAEPEWHRPMPASLEAAVVCDAIDPVWVAELLGGESTRTSSWRPGDRAAPGATRLNHGCQFERRADGPRLETQDQAATTFAVVAGPRRPANLGATRVHYGDDGFAKAGCTMREVEGVPADRGYTVSCVGGQGIDASVPAHHVAALALEHQLLRCVLRGPPASPLPADREALTRHCFEVLEKAASRPVHRRTPPGPGAR